jgi:hypothetical protein
MGTGGSFAGGKAAGLKADHAPPPDAEVKNGGSVPPISHTSSWLGVQLNKPGNKFTFYSFISLSTHSCIHSVSNRIKSDVVSDVAQAVSRQFPTASARLRFRVRSYGICGGQSDTGVGFLRALEFPLPILILTTPPRLLISCHRCYTMVSILTAVKCC